MKQNKKGNYNHSSFLSIKEGCSLWVDGNQITYKRKRFSVYLGAENILNVMQKNAIISPDDPFGSYFDATQIWSPINGVNIYAGMHFTIKQKKK